jgi:hypothetical protein
MRLLARRSTAGLPTVGSESECLPQSAHEAASVRACAGLGHSVFQRCNVFCRLLPIDISVRRSLIRFNTHLKQCFGAVGDG